jgi:hypothetical protein
MSYIGLGEPQTPQAPNEQEPQTPRAPSSPPQTPKANEQEPQTPKAPLSPPQTPKAPPSPPPSPPQTPKAPNEQEPQTPCAPPSPPQTPKAKGHQEPQTPKAKGQREPKAPKKQPTTVQKEQPTTVQKEQPTTVPKEPFVLYLGVDVAGVELTSIMSLPNAEALFEKYPDLKHKENFHITLHFFPKKCANKGEIVDKFKQFIKEHGAKVVVTVTGIGYHEGTCALQVSPSILTADGSNTHVPWIHNKQNHITVALEEGKNAKDSINAVMKQEESGDYPGDFIPFEPPIIITGHLKLF